MTMTAPLEIGIVEGRLVISVGIATLAQAIEWSPDLFLHDAKTGEFIGPRITDTAVFAKEIALILQREEEDGTTLVHRLLDKAASEAIDQGAEGVSVPAIGL